MSAKNNKTKKKELAEKVKEIQMRQKNWLQQREQHLKSKDKPSSATSTGTKKPSEKKSEAPVLYHESQKAVISQSNTQSVNPSQKFKTWLQARDQTSADRSSENAYDDDDSVNILKVSSSRTPGYASPQSDEGGYMYKSAYHERDDALDKLMSPQDFNALADSIVSRVKHDLSLQDSTSGSSVGGGMKDKRRSELSRINSEMASTSTQAKIDTSGHNCPLCSRLMVPPYNEPMINIPCGHSVCQQCCVSHVCPSCQCHVTSRMCNMMLLQIIQDYHTRELYSREKISASASSYSPEIYRENSSASTYKKRKNYEEEKENLLARKDILQSELRSVKQNVSHLEHQKMKLQKQVQNISSEEDKIRGQISSLEEKLRALLSHKEEYKGEQNELKQKITTETNKLNLIQDTLMDVGIQLEKVRLLAENS